MMNTLFIRREYMTIFLLVRIKQYGDCSEYICRIHGKRAKRGNEFYFSFIAIFLMKQHDESKADDHEKGAHKPFPDIGFLEKQVSEENAHEEA